MKVRTGLLMLVVATGAVWAQTSQAPATATAPAASSGTTQPQSSAEAKPSAKPAKKHSSKKATAAQSEANVATNVASSKPKHAVGPGKRDPFISPVRANQNEPINCGTGKRCLVVDQTILQGIVKAPNGMIAVVSNAANKAYFLRENDPVYNGFVMRITPDSVVFREQMTDKLGKKYTREVVKKVNAPVV
jgi:hypothetical protein